MKRTISEVIDLIKEKIDNCEKDAITIHNTEMGLLTKTNKISELFGVKQAYTDVLSLLESSHLIEQEKVLEMLKVLFDISVEEIEKGVFTKYQLKTHKRCKNLSKEEYDLLSEVFKDEE